jgi:hypothetical protein
MVMQSKQRDQRELRALELLRLRYDSTAPTCSAFDIGNAAVRGEAKARSIPMRARELIGLSCAVELVRRHLAVATKGNCFQLLPASS